MTADQVMSEQIRLGALERHIYEALKRENLPLPTAALFRAHLKRVLQARALITENAELKARLAGIDIEAAERRTLYVPG